MNNSIDYKTNIDTEIVNSKKISCSGVGGSLGHPKIFLEFKNYRFSGQYEGDTQLYQPQEEIDKAKQNDPIKLAKENSSKYGLNKNDLEKIINEAKEEVDKAFDFADTQPWPQPEDALEEVYVNYPVEINR